MAEVNEVERRLNNLAGIIQEFDDIYPAWEDAEEFEQLDFAIEWDQAVGQFEFLQRSEMTQDQRMQFSEISSCIKDRISKLQEKRLQIPVGI